MCVSSRLISFSCSSVFDLCSVKYLDHYRSSSSKGNEVGSVIDHFQDSDNIVATFSKHVQDRLRFANKLFPVIMTTFSPPSEYDIVPISRLVQRFMPSDITIKGKPYFIAIPTLAKGHI